jgi:hypothetical protein
VVWTMTVSGVLGTNTWQICWEVIENDSSENAGIRVQVGRFAGARLYAAWARDE